MPCKVYGLPFHEQLFGFPAINDREPKELFERNTHSKSNRFDVAIMNPNFRPPSQDTPPDLPPQLPSRPRNRNGGSWWGDIPPGMLIGGGFFLLWVGISALAWLGSALLWPAYYLVRSLDVATGGAALPIAPWIAWTVWGTVVGGALGYWLVAPAYGQRANRALILLAPVLVLIACSALLWVFVR